MLTVVKMGQRDEELMGAQEDPEMKRAVKVFYWYDREDKIHATALEKRLKHLRDSLSIEPWSEDNILAGRDRKSQINKQVAESNIVLLLVSPDFLASDECLTIKQQAMKWHKKGRIFSVVPIIVRPVLDRERSFEGLQALPKSVSSVSESRNRDKIWVEVQRGIAEVINNFLSQPQPSNVRNGFAFIGLRPKDGYHWDYDLRPAPGLTQQEDMPDAPWLVSVPIGSVEYSQRYSIFTEHNILREFANLPHTEKAIRRFANRYGYLSDLVPLYYPSKVGTPDSILWAGESLQFWVDAIEELQMLVTLWDMVRYRQIEALKKYIIWKQDPKGVLFVWRSHSRAKGSVIFSENMPFTITSENDSPAFFYQLTPGEVMRPALYYIADEVRKRLAGHVNPTFFLSQQNSYMVPDSLLSALYVLVLLEMQEHAIEPESDLELPD